MRRAEHFTYATLAAATYYGTAVLVVLDDGRTVFGRILALGRHALRMEGEPETIPLARIGSMRSAASVHAGSA